MNTTRRIRRALAALIAGAALAAVPALPSAAAPADAGVVAKAPGARLVAGSAGGGWVDLGGSFPAACTDHDPATVCPTALRYVVRVDGRQFTAERLPHDAVLFIRLPRRAADRVVAVRVDGELALRAVLPGGAR